MIIKEKTVGKVQLIQVELNEKGEFQKSEHLIKNCVVHTLKLMSPGILFIS